MAAKIIEVACKILFGLISIIFSFVLSAFPNTDFSVLTNIFSLFLGFCEQAYNLLYFVSGGTLHIWVTIWIDLWTFSHLILPIINFSRKAIADLF